MLGVCCSLWATGVFNFFGGVKGNSNREIPCQARDLNQWPSNHTKAPLTSPPTLPGLGKPFRINEAAGVRCVQNIRRQTRCERPQMRRDNPPGPRKQTRAGCGTHVSVHGCAPSKIKGGGSDSMRITSLLPESFWDLQHRSASCASK